MVQLQRKAPDDDNFMLESSKSALDLTVSHHRAPPQDKERDSLIFEFEPEKRKGVTVTSKSAQPNNSKPDLPQDLPKTSNPLTSNRRSQDLPQTTNALTSVRRDDPQMPSAPGETLVSKELGDMEKLLK